MTDGPSTAGNAAGAAGGDIELNLQRRDACAQGGDLILRHIHVRRIRRVRRRRSGFHARRSLGTRHRSGCRWPRVAVPGLPGATVPRRAIPGRVWAREQAAARRANARLPRANGSAAADTGAGIGSGTGGGTNGGFTASTRNCSAAGDTDAGIGPGSGGGTDGRLTASARGRSSTRGAGAGAGSGAVTGTGTTRAVRRRLDRGGFEKFRRAGAAHARLRQCENIRACAAAARPRNESRRHPPARLGADARWVRKGNTMRSVSATGGQFADDDFPRAGA